MNDIEAKIIDFLKNEFALAKDSALDGSLFQSGTIDSMNLVRLIGFIEEKFGVRVFPSEVTIENFDSVLTIARFVHRKTEGNKAALSIKS